MAFSDLLERALDDADRSARLERLILVASVPLAIVMAPLAALGIGLVFASQNGHGLGVGILAMVSVVATAIGRAAYRRFRAARGTRQEIEPAPDSADSVTPAESAESVRDSVADPAE